MKALAHQTVSETVHAVVQSARISARPLNVRGCARDIARLHGIQGSGVWLVEQALLMVGSRAGINLKIGDDWPSEPPSDAVQPLRAANSN